MLYYIILWIFFCEWSFAGKLVMESFLTSLTTLKVSRKSWFILRLLLSMSLLKFLLVRRLFSLKKAESAFNASSISCKKQHDLSDNSEFLFNVNTPNNFHWASLISTGAYLGICIYSCVDAWLEELNIQ